jgi:hypothetical protein
MTTDLGGGSALHLSQKFFWFAASISLLVGTFVFSWRVYQGHNASVELLGIRFTSEEAERSVVATRDQLLAIRTRLSDAASGDPSAMLQQVMPELDGLLKTLGVAEAALKKQQTNPLFGTTDYYEDSSAGYANYYPIPTPTPRRHRVDETNNA